MDNNLRERSRAVFDKRKSFQNYKKIDEKIPEGFLKRLSSTRIEELEKEKIIEENPSKTYNLPNPPKFSGELKHYKSKSNKPVTRI